jgi:hypothetical protein
MQNNRQQLPPSGYGYHMPQYDPRQEARWAAGGTTAWMPPKENPVQSNPYQAMSPIMGNGQNPYGGGQGQGGYGGSPSYWNQGYQAPQQQPWYGGAGGYQFNQNRPPAGVGGGYGGGSYFGGKQNPYGGSIRPLQPDLMLPPDWSSGGGGMTPGTSPEPVRGLGSSHWNMNPLLGAV